MILEFRKYPGFWRNLGISEESTVLEESRNFGGIQGFGGILEFWRDPGFGRNRRGVERSKGFEGSQGDNGRI